MFATRRASSLRRAGATESVATPSDPNTMLDQSHNGNAGGTPAFGTLLYATVTAGPTAAASNTTATRAAAHQIITTCNQNVRYRCRIRMPYASSTPISFSFLRIASQNDLAS